MRRARNVAAALAATAVLLGGCRSGTSSSAGASRPTLTVSAAASLQNAFPEYGKGFAPAASRFSFAGSDELAAQIRQGVRPDVFAAANTKLPDSLYHNGLVEKPTVFATNTFVIAVPTSSTKVKTLADLARRGVTIAAGSPTVPIGTYTRETLAMLPPSEGKRIEANIKSNEPDVTGVVGKVSQGAVDAGFVYISDVKATGGKLRAITVPAALQPRVAYGAAVVKGSKHSRQAKAFIAGLLVGRGRQILRAAGFGPPPAP
jgi:molybdate transport system substrate-binding protein